MGSDDEELARLARLVRESAVREPEFDHLLRKSRDAMLGGREAWSPQSTGEKLAVAMVLNKPEWIAAMDYTLAEAIYRIGPEWLELIPRVMRALRDEPEWDSAKDQG